MSDYHHVADSDECHRCGATIRRDKDGEYRHRFLLEDHARSTIGEARGKLCGDCWHAIEGWVNGK